MTDEVKDQEAKAAADAKAKADAEATAKQKDPAYLEAELKKVIAQREAEKEKAKANAAAAEELAKLKQAQMTEAEKTAARIKELEGADERAKVADAALQKRLDADLAAVPENMRHLVHGSTPAEKLDHLTDLKAAGVFGQKQDSQGARFAAQGNGLSTITETEFANLSLKDMEVWRARILKGGARKIPG